MLLESSDVVYYVEKDKLMYISIIYMFEYMGFFVGVWVQIGGVGNVGEGIVIGVVDIGIYFDYLSFVNDFVNLYVLYLIFKGMCGIDVCVFVGFCNGKIIGVRQFFEVVMVGVNVLDLDMFSFLDGYGYGM